MYCTCHAFYASCMLVMFLVVHVVYVCVYGTCGACIYVLDMCIWWYMYVYLADV